VFRPKKTVHGPFAAGSLSKVKHTFLSPFSNFACLIFLAYVVTRQFFLPAITYFKKNLLLLKSHCSSFTFYFPDFLPMPETQNITDLLLAWSEGEDLPLERLMSLVEGELRRIAARYMHRENSDHTLQTTALVNEAYLKLIDQRKANWQNRAHFFALASKIMRRVLLDHAKGKRRAKRGGGAVHLDISDVAVMLPVVSDEVIDLDEALTRLAKHDELKSQIIEMRYFGGLTVEEVADVLRLAPITVMRHDRMARAWLRVELEK
jgi:RNA polymerase sigma factor (TIGR02999 family)